MGSNWLKFNSSYVVHLLSEREATVPWKFWARFSNYMYFIQTFTFRASHIFREGNCMANILSKKVLSNTNMFWQCNLLDFYNHARWEDASIQNKYRFTK